MMADHPETTARNQASDDMVEGFRDGYDLSTPEPSSNRSHSYRHGFANGRDDRSGTPRANSDELRRMAFVAEMMDQYGAQWQDHTFNAGRKKT